MEGGEEMLSERRFTCLSKAVREDVSEQMNFLNKELMRSGAGA